MTVVGCCPHKRHLRERNLDLKLVCITSNHISTILFLGLIAMILFIVSLVLGLLTNYAQKLTKYGRPITFKFVHNTVGVLGFIIGVVSLCYGYYTKWFVYFTTSEARIFVTVATVLGSLWALNGALVSGFNQAKSLYGSGNNLRFCKTFSKRTESDDIDERL